MTALVPWAPASLGAVLEHPVLELVVDHMGALHPYERLLVAVVAFGPFLVAGVVVYVVRKRDIAAEEHERAEAGAPGDPTEKHPAEPDPADGA